MKKIIIIGIIILIILVALITVLLLNRQENKDSISKTETTVLDISQVFDIDDIEKSKYEIEKAKAKDIQISSKYIVGSNIYKVNANVEFMEDTGKMLYIRESYNKLNIYQEEQKIDEYDNMNSQVKGIIENFENKCKSYLGIDDEDKGREVLSGESTTKGAIPIGESIYYENREYSKSYDLDGKTYAINFYKNGTEIVCELVYEM